MLETIDGCFPLNTVIIQIQATLAISYTAMCTCIYKLFKKDTDLGSIRLSRILQSFMYTV